MRSDNGNFACVGLVAGETPSRLQTFGVSEGDETDSVIMAAAEQASLACIAIKPHRFLILVQMMDAPLPRRALAVAGSHCELVGSLIPFEDIGQL